MKTRALALLGIITLTLPCFGQMNILHNYYRSGDVLIKQQIKYRNPGASGANRLWNFSKLQTINEAYRLVYYFSPLEDDSVYIHGGKRFRKKEIKDDEPMVVMRYPLNYVLRITAENVFVNDIVIKK